MISSGFAERTTHGVSGVTFLVDASMYGERNALPREVYGDMDQVVRPDLHYHYSGPICAHRWLEVCDDPSYGHETLMSRMENVFPSLIDALRADCGDPSSVSLTSLGPGDGSLDERMLQCLDNELRVGSYCGLDFSFELLRRAVHRIARVEGLRSVFPIVAVCGDFTDLEGAARSELPERCVQMFTMTGLTLGNYQEDDLLGRVGRLMRQGDYLFLDARLHAFSRWPLGRSIADQERRLVLESYDLASVREFVFGPVEVATFARAQEAEIAFEITPALTVVPNAFNVVIYCTGIDTVMRFTGKRVRKDRVDLAITTQYNYVDLLPWFGTMGFVPVWHRDVGGIAMFLLRRE